MEEEKWLKKMRGVVLEE
jgi:hypothetical protein